MNVMVEYIWIGGKGELRSKTKIVKEIEANSPPPEWGFDGSSTGQSTPENSDLKLNPIFVCTDPLRGEPHRLALCEVLTGIDEPAASNHRRRAESLGRKHMTKDCLFGLEQEYTLTIGKNEKPLGLALGGYGRTSTDDIPEQGQFYCGIGANNVYGRKIAEEHMQACLATTLPGGNGSLLYCGMNAEVMPGQWEFQIGPGRPLEVGDRLWIARYLLLKIAEKHGISVSFASKPHPKLNGAGCHTNFSTRLMRESLNECFKAAQKLGDAVTSDGIKNYPVRDTRYAATSFPSDYGSGYKERLTGDCETCSWKQFKFGVADRTASIRIPLHVKEAGKGYIEDRRPCADIDPYRVTAYIMETVL
jgi:glutamine synthetase